MPFLRLPRVPPPASDQKLPGSSINLASYRLEKKQAQKEIEAGKSDQGENRVAAAHHFAVALLCAKQTLDKPGLPSELGHDIYFAGRNGAVALDRRGRAST